MTKAEQVADLIEQLAAAQSPGSWIGSVASLGAEIAASTGTVLAGVELAQMRGVPIERRRGPEGGYFKAGPAEKAVTASTNIDHRGIIMAALAQARNLRRQTNELVRTLEEALK